MFVILKVSLISILAIGRGTVLLCIFPCKIGKDRVVEGKRIPIRKIQLFHLNSPSKEFWLTNEGGKIKVKAKC